MPVTAQSLDQLAINSIRFLAVDAIDCAICQEHNSIGMTSVVYLE
jgi:hypothetical protein